MPSTLRDLARRPLADFDVPERIRERLALMGIEHALDLLQHYPRRYHDRTNRVEIEALEPGAEALVIGEVVRVSGRRTRGGRALVELAVSDGAARLPVTFFNQAWREKQLPAGTEVALFGKVDTYRGRLQMTNPVVDVLARLGEKTGRIMPLYPQSSKADLVSWQVHDAVAPVLDGALPLAEPLPAPVRRDLKLVDRTTAYRDVHRPDTIEAARRARRRLRFDEFFRMQLALVRRKRQIEAARDGIAHATGGLLVDRFLRSLPFELTTGQRRVLDDVLADLGRPVPMHRLLQGEVGSGKTVVALAALLTGVEGGYQGAFMAPTEVLAEQHAAVLRELLAGLEVPAPDGSLLPDRPVRVELLTNRTRAAERRRLAQGLADGVVDIVVGTHALLYGDAPFTRLGVVVIDEQHRFGVEQRALLTGHGDAGGGAGAGTDAGTGAGAVAARRPRPDVLVMTATPIPRTAAMLLYGDLDRSELRELPAGRPPLRTTWLRPAESAPAYERIRREVAAGRQAYVICPLVEGSPKLEAKAATTELERLAGAELAGLRLQLLHGQMRPADKDAAMDAFRAGAADVLVATTVVEVGVDVPNATVMVIEDADRFGLLQLHQLRGRIGRGTHASECFLVADPSTEEGEARMRAMVGSRDGFELAERDLEIRGAGQVFGERQAGFGDLKLGRIPRDEPYIVHARALAEAVLDEDPTLARVPQLREEVEDLVGGDVAYLFKS